MNDVPFRIPQPVVDLLDSRAGMLSITSIVHDVGFVLQHLYDVRCVAQRNGVADDQDFGQLSGDGSTARNDGKQWQDSFHQVNTSVDERLLSDGSENVSHFCSQAFHLHSGFAWSAFCFCR